MHEPSLRRRFWRLAVFNILSNLMVPLAGLVDVALLGHLADIRHLAGVALAAVLFDYVYWTFGFLRMGTTGMTAQAVGRRDRDEVVITAIRGWAIALIVAAVLLILRRPLADLGFLVLSGTGEVEAAGRDYFAARIWGAPATLLNFVFLGWFLGREQAGRALVLSVVGNGANVILDYIFIFRLGMESTGAGAATAISQYLMLAVALGFTAKDIHWEELKRLTRRALTGAGLGRTFALNGDILVRTLALISVFAAFTNIASTFGTISLAVIAVVKNVVTFAAFFIDGYAFATESLAGIFEGEGRIDRLRRLLAMAMGWSLVTGLAFAACFTIWQTQLFGLLTDHQVVLDGIGHYVWWLFPVLGVGSLAYALDGYFIGLTRGRILSSAMVAAALVGFAPLGYWAWKTQSPQLLWLALSVFMVARVISLGVFVPGTLRSSRGMPETG